MPSPRDILPNFDDIIKSNDLTTVCDAAATYLTHLAADTSYPSRYRRKLLRTAHMLIELGEQLTTTPPYPHTKPPNP